MFSAFSCELVAFVRVHFDGLIKQPQGKSDYSGKSSTGPSRVNASSQAPGLRSSQGSSARVGAASCARGRGLRSYVQLPRPQAVQRSCRPAWGRPRAAKGERWASLALQLTDAGPQQLCLSSCQVFPLEFLKGAFQRHPKMPRAEAPDLRPDLGVTRKGPVPPGRGGHRFRALVEPRGLRSAELMPKDGAAATFGFGCFGFLASRLVLFWPFAMISSCKWGARSLGAEAGLGRGRRSSHKRGGDVPTA